MTFLYSSHEVEVLSSAKPLSQRVPDVGRKWLDTLSTNNKISTKTQINIKIVADTLQKKKILLSVYK